MSGAQATAASVPVDNVLQEKNIDGWPMLPICDACMKAGKKLVKKNGKHDLAQQRRERVAKSQEARAN